MIEAENLTIEGKNAVLNHISLDVKDGEIYVLMCKSERCSAAITNIMAGFQTVKEGEFRVDSRPVTRRWNRPMIIINRLEDPMDFEPDLKLRDIVDFHCSVGKLKKKRVLEMLLLFNLFEEDLNKKVRHADAVEIKMLYISLLLSKDCNNIVINDFIRGEEKEFELKFNRVLLQMKKEGKAILYLTGDIFYAYRIADKVSFLKNGYLVPAEPILSKDLKELDAMEVYKKYLV